MSPQSSKIKSIFPKASQYDPKWVRQHSMGENVLYNLESLTSQLPLKKGMRVLDLGCGKAISSIFMAKEFGVKVWAVDEAIAATDNFQRAKEENCDDSVFPLELDARSLPFPEEYFDMVIVVDSYTYFGTDDKYLPYICRFLKPGGYIAIVDVCFTHEIETLNEVPRFLRRDYQNYWYFIHSVNWWKKLWEKTGLVNVICAEELPEKNIEVIRNEYIKDYAHSRQNDPFATALEKDKKNLISFFRLIGQRTSKSAYLQSYK